MSLTEEFLWYYKSLETLLRGVYGSDMSVLNFEGKSTEPEKLRMCRLVRNFLQHTPDGDRFIVPTEAMVSFLKQESARVAAQAEKAKDLSYRQSPVKISHSLLQAAKLFVSSGRTWLPVVDEKSAVIGVLGKDTLFVQMASGKDLSAKTVSVCFTAKGWKDTLDGFTVADCESVLAGMDLDRVIVTRKGKYSGLIDLR